MVRSCFVIWKWAGADASHRQALANDCQNAKEKSFSLAGEAFNLAIMITVTVSFSLCLPLSLFSMQLLYCVYVFVIINAEMVICLEDIKNTMA